MIQAAPTRILLTLWLVFLLSGCLAPQVSTSSLPIRLTIQADGKTQTVEVPTGSTIGDALKAAGVETNTLDRVEPPSYAQAQDGSQVTIIRVREEFQTVQTVLPFERQTVRNESLPAGETRLIQAGVNGSQEITYRRVIENEQEISYAPVKVVVLQAAAPEIVMVGVQAGFISLSIPGRLAYLSNGNAWLMEGSTANRRPILSDGDLDGRVFRLSPDGQWLLYTRKSQKPPAEEINTLWAYNFEDPSAQPIHLKISNVIHFADWIPGGTTTYITYSTVEPRAAAPGWQANNDLYTLKFGANGVVGKPGEVVSANTGGVYGWWGTQFIWSPDGKRLAYSRPDGIGLVSFKDKGLLPLLDITPLQTRSDWALIPGLAWGGDSQTMYLVTHAPPPGLVNPEESPFFDLGAFSLETGANVRLVKETGMFAYPAASQPSPRGSENSYRVAYLQALAPQQSQTSGYRLVIMDRDGSNRQTLFPALGAPGLQPQTPAWMPAQFSGVEGDFVAVVYQGNLWLVDVATGQASQATGDGLIQKIDWK